MYNRASLTQAERTINDVPADVLRLFPAVAFAVGHRPQVCEKVWFVVDPGMASYTGASSGIRFPVFEGETCVVKTPPSLPPSQLFPARVLLSLHLFSYRC